MRKGKGWHICVHPQHQESMNTYRFTLKGNLFWKRDDEGIFGKNEITVKQNLHKMFSMKVKKEVCMLQTGAHLQNQEAVLQKYFSLQEYVMEVYIVDRKYKLVLEDSKRVIFVLSILNLKVNNQR